MLLLFIKGVPFFISHYRKTAMDCYTDSSVIYKTVEKVRELKAKCICYTASLDVQPTRISVGMVTRPWIVGVVAILSVVG